ncbi:hypothetical protein D3C76_1307400 [compost metagenome]
MDKRVLSSLDRNIRGKKRATLSDDREPIDTVQGLSEAHVMALLQTCKKAPIQAIGTMYLFC